MSVATLYLQLLCWISAVQKFENDKILLLAQFLKQTPMRKRIQSRHSFLLFFLLSIPCFTFSQGSDSTKVVSNFGGAVTVTNNGISFIPTFSLGKPAAIFDMTVGRKLSFEPQFRFALEGKPWSFVFWWRYKLLKTNKVAVTLGAHPAIIFRTITDTTNGVSQEIIRAQRNAAAEISPNYYLTKDISIGTYYLYGHSFEKDVIRNVHYLTLNANFSNIRLPYKFYLKFNPQVYYLRMDEQDGFYFSTVITLANRKIPLSISTLMNKIIQTNITASDNFVWNVSLIYSFNKKYVEQ